MTRTHPTTATFKSGPLRVAGITAGITLAVDLAAQGSAWTTPPPPPALRALTGPLTAGAVATAVATVALWGLLPLQLVGVAVVVALASPGRHSAGSGR